MPAIVVRHLFTAVLSLGFLLFEEEFWPLHSIDVHELVTRLWHWQVVGFALFKPPMEALELLELVEHVFDVADLARGSLRDLLHEILGEIGLPVLFLVVHGRADLVLLLELLHFLVFTPEHDLDS